MKALALPLAAGDLGDPVGGATSYALCIYDGALVAAVTIDRAGDTCGRLARPCWKRAGRTGLRYGDRLGTVHGLRRLVLRGGASGSGEIVLMARMDPRRSISGLPPGVPGALVGADSVTTQLVSSDAACFSLTTDDVTGSDAARFAGRRR
jgi:hypothetical protein